MTLFEYFTKLAPEGETALIVKQIDTGRKCLDGSPRYTWPAYKPTHKRGDGESWFLSTGSFIVDRFKNGKPSASSANCTHTLFIMLDDIGEMKHYVDKSFVVKTPPLPPTAIVETSPGNYQWWYAYREQPTVEEHTALLNALIAGEYCDRGATNPVRNCRLPGSVNVKPGREAFVCREVEFHPEREYTVQEICDAFGVRLGEISPLPQNIRLTDTGTDDVLTWLNEQGLVTESVNGSGWCGIVCPNHAEHTNGDIQARYMPQSRAFCCYHGHCENLDSNYFCDWVAEQGGPRHKPGIRDELIVEAMKPLSGLKPTKEYPNVADEIKAETERKQAGRENRAGWHNRFAYIMVDDAYFDRHTCTEISRKAFNALFKGVDCTVASADGKARRVEASTWFDTFREDYGAYALQGMTYAAGDDWMVTNGGLVYGNVWRNARPKVTDSGDPQMWIDHCRRLVPDERELEHIWDVMAVKAQQPRTKINHAILHGGNGGIGKDTMWYPLLWAVGGADMKNVAIMDRNKINSDFGYHFQSEIIVLNELKEPEAKERRALANKLKPVIAAPPDMLTVNRKGLHPYEMPNRLFVLAFTNESMPITLDSDDRRWFCIWSDAPKMTPAEIDRIWGWYRSGGLEAVAGWLRARDVSAFNPKAIPFSTEYKQRLIHTGMSHGEAYVYHLIEKGEAPFDVDVIGGPWHKILDIVNAPLNGSTRVVQPALLHALKEAGWVDKGLCYSTDFPTRKHCFVKPQIADWSRSDIRRRLAALTREKEDTANVVSIAERISSVHKTSG